MAKNDSLATYKARGSAGPITYANWKGIGYFKQKAFTVANPKTDGQINARARLALMVALFADVGAAVQVGFKEMAVKMSQYNAFVKYNINTALTYVSLGVYTVDWSLIQFAKGTLGNTAISSAAASAATNNATIVYSNVVTSFNQSLDDLAMVCYNNITTGVGGFNSTSGAERQDGTVTIAIEGGVTAGDDIHLWLFFKQTTGNKISDSVYLNITAGA